MPLRSRTAPAGRTPCSPIVPRRRPRSPAAAAPADDRPARASPLPEPSRTPGIARIAARPSPAPASLGRERRTPPWSPTSPGPPSRSRRVHRPPARPARPAGHPYRHRPPPRDARKSTAWRPMTSPRPLGSDRPRWPRCRPRGPATAWPDWSVPGPSARRAPTPSLSWCHRVELQRFPGPGIAR